MACCRKTAMNTISRGSNHYQWRLHPPSPVPAAKNPPCVPNGDTKQQYSNVSNTKFLFRLHDDVYIRPKSVKELGISGRIVDIYDATKKSNAIASKHESIPRGKKRRLVEDIRVSIQQHSFGDTIIDRNSDHRLSDTVKIGVRPSRLFPIYDMRNHDGGKTNQQPSLILLTPDTTNYRQLASSHLRPFDKVLEIGCSTGECTALIVRRLLLLHSQRARTQEYTDIRHGQVVAFDTGSDMIEKARTRVLSEFDNLTPKSAKDCDENTAEKDSRQMIQYHRVDALENPLGAYSYAVGRGDDSENSTPDMILIDIGGNRELRGVVRMIQWVQSSFQDGPPRVIIVKSEALVEELSRYADSKKNVTEHDGEDEPFVAADGIINNGQDWFLSLLTSSENASNGIPGKSKQSPPTYSHPIKAPLVLSPKDGKTPICRFHNYALDGCKNGDACPFDHDIAIGALRLAMWH
eukprot:CAMPEP_0183719342 /NCGR_PEP_ID=MMETSP0737-20130205/12329_1 /TAXON_ID=385413 /ORGANISM="Thalassiosira miniscula, Strain CCMP1093" /LENGTH=462 /DNA_ID=CAMNT_0025949059 /DNA_START=76 /DNA_END=1465 /DNA_ORIENTATION=+